ncbi:hypothetical protein A3B18_02885 [Candidatus Giovannonibacteria bacterium RIFCSPLOWO2_01_FULL_46_13]|uniref:Fatty acid hydroxylase domain-containing protein n=1 Tax=Candidatus Giovannonibacteria bacterium RIFCSPLOWO2_01_FULL_46_13 TaxID=1798352 RepID=A0A1F5X301_9BACT|nr:MAG: hypothetical protein A3B18_02885 [Candidatus Giovannonibacteria bacterium RIFCSPLOWO2_01_FULL_46_13]
MYYQKVIRSTNEWVFLWLISILFVFWFLAKDTFIAQATSGLVAIFSATAAVIVINIFVEWGFHKYVLHGMFPGFLRNHWPVKSFYEAHDGVHHVLTPVAHYAILEEAQTKSSTFPFWSLPVFILIYLPFLLLAQAFFSGPIILGGILGVTASYTSYENLHALYHADYELFWRERIETPGWRGKCWEKVFEYHKKHHADSSKNLNMVFPLADCLLGTVA